MKRTAKAVHIGDRTQYLLAENHKVLASIAPYSLKSGDDDT